MIRSPALYRSVAVSHGSGCSCFRPSEILRALAVDLQHLRLDLLPHRQHIFRRAHPAPRNIAHVQQPVDAAQIHKRAEARQPAHLPPHHLAFFERRKLVQPLGERLLLQHRAPVHDHVFVRHIQLRDPAGDLLPDQLLQLARIARAAARSRHKRAHAHIHAHAALHHPRHRARNRQLLREGLFQLRPVPGLRHARQ